MKKILSLTIAAVMLLSILTIGVSADESGIDVYVTIADDKGELALALEKIAVADRDGDGKYTVDEVLFAAHEAKYEGGAEAGYAAADTQWGISLMKLWGVDNGGSYSYYINNASSVSLGNEVKDGDCVNAFIYTDLTAWSDKYCFFDKTFATAVENEELTLTLMGAGYDENWNPVTLPVANAAVTVNGEETEIVTDAGGKATLTLDKAGSYVISVKGSGEILVPPATVVTVVEKAPQTGIEGVGVWAVIALCCACGIILTAKKNNEI